MTETAPDQLRIAVEEALAMLRAEAAELPADRALPGAPLPGLLAQCRELLAAAPSEERPTLRCLHHFACTGGTLIAKALAGLPNTHLLSELDPLSRMGRPAGAPPRFAPQNLILQLLYSYPDAPDDLVADVFLAGLERLVRRLGDQGQRVVLRDHAHSHFCWGPDIPQRPTLREMVTPVFDTHAIVTVRHPLDSYLSLQNQGWLHFRPADLETYAQRYMAFLDRYPDVEIFRYETFVEAPEATLEDMATALRLPYRPEALSLLDAFQISGDSGRKSGRIGPRPRRPVTDDLAKEIASSQTYPALLKRLTYD